MEINNFQRLGSTSNTQVGRDFEDAVQAWFSVQGVSLLRSFPAPVGFISQKYHSFDLGSAEPPILIECKAHTWTQGKNLPSAKIHAVNVVMLHFSIAPSQFRKVLVMQKDVCSKRSISLASYYVRSYSHLIPEGVEVWEFCTETLEAERVH